MKNFCFCSSLKSGAFIVAFVSIIEGISEFIGGTVELFYTENEGDTTLFVVCMLIGILTILFGGLLIIGIVNAKEQYILFFVLLRSVNLFIVTIYSGYNMFENAWLLLFLVYAVVSWYFQFCVYSFYEETLDYNKVSSGVIEISYNERNSNLNKLVSQNSAYESDAL